MRALRYHGNKDLRIDEIPEPECKPGFVKIKIAWCGICGSDIGEYANGPRIWGMKKHVLTNDGEMPYCMGHEMSGEVAEVAPDITDLKVGQHVVIDPLIDCGKCYSCEAGVGNLCVARGFHGFAGWGGGLSEYMCCKRKSVIPIPDDYPLDVAALVEPLAVGWNAVALTDAQPGLTVLVTGAGPIGLAVLLSLKARDPRVKVFVSAPKSARSELAMTYGAEAVFDPKEVDVIEAVKAATNGDGVHVAYECAGVGSALPVAVQSLRSGGMIVNASVYMKGEPVTIDPNLLTRRGIIYKGSMGYYPGCFAEVVEALVSGKMQNPEKMITTKISLEDAEEKGFKAVLGRKPGTVKVIVSPGRTV